MRDHIQENHIKLLEAMTKAGVLSATITYNGSGDSGFVEDITLNPPPEESPSVEFTKEYHSWISGKSTIEFNTLTEPLEVALESFTYQILDELHPGWEINDGANGTLELDRVEDKLTLDHTEFYTESKNHYYEL